MRHLREIGQQRNVCGEPGEFTFFIPGPQCVDCLRIASPMQKSDSPIIQHAIDHPDLPGAREVIDTYHRSFYPVDPVDRIDDLIRLLEAVDAYRNRIALPVS